MREDVGIVLNEREPLKAKLAEELAERLKRSDITASRISIDAKIEDTVLRRRPQVLILDYLLGDHSTGLDVLRRLKELDEPLRPKAIFLTDEPSVPVAVEALRQGALNYIESDHPQAVSKTISEVERVLETKPISKPKRARDRRSLEELVAHTPIMRETLAHLKRAAAQRVSALTIWGPEGSGRRTLARSYAGARGDSFAVEIDIREWPYPLSDLLTRARTGGFALGDPCGYLFIGEPVHHSQKSEAPDGNTELLDFLANHKKLFGPSGSWLCFISNDEKSARAAKKLLGGEIVTTKPLSEHSGDVAPLTQSFIREAYEFLGQKQKLPDTAALSALAQMSWPGNISELRSVVIAAGIDHALSDIPFSEAIQTHKLAWEEEQSAQQARTVAPLTAASCLAQNQGNFRITAAKLGISVATLRNLLNGGRQ